MSKLIKILVDDKSSWMTEYGIKITKSLNRKGYKAEFINSHNLIGKGWCLFLLSCSKRLKDLNDFDYNIVIHASDLPRGKGWSPLTWQILEGKNVIPISVIEASDKIDGGDIYFKENLNLNGSELIEEIRKKLAKKIEHIVFRIIKDNNFKTKKQLGNSTFFSKRLPKDSILDPKKTIEEQFNLFRVSDNEKYPVFFYLNGDKYYLKIYKN